MEFVIITGLSGAGKTQASRFLEDIGFYTVDNMPPALMPKFAEFCLNGSGKYERVALVSDVRAGDSFEPLLHALDALEEMGCNYQLLFMEAQLPTIIKRYKETRRLHPLAGADCSLEEAARKEREMLAPVRARAGQVVDTTEFASTNMLRGYLQKLFCAEEMERGLSVQVMSFGYKYGLPLEADLVLDVRFLPNPYYVPELKALTGKEEGIVAYLDSFPATAAFLEKLDDMLSYLLPLYAEEGRRTLTLAVGCTGGRHRSVAIASRVAQRVKALGYSVAEYHRDMARA